MRLFISYLTDLDEQSLATPELRALVVAHIYELFALALRTATENPSDSDQKGGNDLFRAIANDILRNLAERDLSIVQVAANNGISVRRLQRRLESEGVTFSQFVPLQRLQRVYDALLDVRQAHRSVSSIALSNGFGDVSHFNKAFRARFGKAPSAVRRELTGRRKNSGAAPKDDGRSGGI